MANIIKSTLFRVSIKELEGKKTNFHIVEDSINLDLEGEFSSIDVKGYFQIKGRKVYITGDVSFSANLICSRCGEPFDQELNYHFRLLFLPEDKRKIDEYEGAEVFYYYGDVIDFAEHIRDFVYLAVPIKPLCSIDCKGIDYEH